MRKVSKVLERLLAQAKEKERLWRIRKAPRSAQIRAEIVSRLEKFQKPVPVDLLAYELDLSVSSVRSHLRALIAGKIVCDRLTPTGSGERSRFIYYTICPVCPVSGICDEKEELVWKEHEI